MKKGSGNLDFGGSDDESENDESEPPVADSSGAEQDGSQVQTTTNKPNTDRDPTDEPDSDDQKFPYFVRRSNVGDERDERIEVHLRPEVNEQESDFQSALADELDVGEVAKTDAREFALKFAFANPEDVVELMRDEGYGLID